MITFKELGRQGRFGNCLFQIAGAIGIAIKSNQQYGFPKFIVHDMVDRFGSSEDIEVYKYLVNPLPELPDNLQFQQYPYFWDYRDVYLPNGNWNLNGHFQSVRFFEHCMDMIRHYFTFKDEPEQNDYVAIHYRAGDYIDDQRAYHPRCSKEYYEKAMALFPPDTKFVIFSDDAEYYMKLMGSGIYEVASDNYIEDFKQMKRCKSFITANSSFSHMAALLGTHPDKKIIMPKRWFGEQANGLNFDTLYPPNAIVI